MVNLHSAGLKSLLARGGQSKKGKTNTSDGAECQCACSGPLHIPTDPLEKEKLLRKHSFYFSCSKKSDAIEGTLTHIRGMSLAELEVRHGSQSQHAGG
jgi:hypothetical protein